MARMGACIFVVSLGFAVIAVPVLAHHSHAAYEPVKLISVEGVITEVKWTNPHMWIVLDVPAGDGTTESWGFEGSSTAATVASGISRNILKVGNRVKILAHRSKDQTKRTGLFMGIEVDGKFYARGGGTNIRRQAEVD